MESKEEDHFQSSIRQKSKLPSKRRNKLSSKHRSKSQKTEDGNDRGDCDLFSPVSCTLSRKNSRTDSETGVIIVSDDESNDNLKATGGNSETVKDKQVDLENNRSEIYNFVKNELLNDYVEQAILLDDDRHFNKSQLDHMLNKKENGISSFVRQNNKVHQLKTIGEVSATSLKNSESSPSLICSTPSSNSADKNVTPKVFGINSSENKKLEEHNDEDFGKSHSDISEFSKKLNYSPLSGFSFECERFSESVELNAPSSKKTDLEHKNQNRTSQASDHSTKESVFSNLLNTSEEEKEQCSKFYQKEIEDNALPESRFRSLSLEHLNDCMLDNGHGTTSEIKCEVNSEKNNISEVFSASHDSKKLIYSCPLCWKTFETSQSQMVHMKECAVRHNISTRQLLDALELQEKQSAERLALGLPEIPAAPVVKKPTAKRKTGAGKDSNLQLALALSVSLQEAEEKEQLQEDECLIEAGLGHEVIERQKTMLERFGFTNSKSANLPSTISRTKQGSKKKNKNTVLTQRTKEDRERLITEKIAIILVGEGKNSSSSVLNENVQSAECTMGVMNSLQKYKSESNSLWSAATSSCNEERNHYVRELSSLISPCKVKAGEKIKHLSQVPGRNISPTRSEVPSNDRAQANDQSESLSTESKTGQSLHGFFAEKDTSNKRLAESLIRDWRAMLNRKAMSDIKIFVGSEQEIPGHRLVFYARCRFILKDIIIEKRAEKSTFILVWIDVSYRAALAFLQFIYCGLTSKILRLNEKDLLGVKELAQRYRVTELLEHLKVMNKVRANVNKEYSPNSSQFHNKLVTPSKSFSPVQYEHTPQQSDKNEIRLTQISQHYSESAMHFSEEFSPRLPSESIDISGNNTGIFPDTSMNIANNDTQEINMNHTSTISNETKNELNTNSPSSKQNTVRSTSPDLFMEEENGENIQVTSNGLSQESGMELNYLLKMFDICLTQNTQERTPQQKSPMKSNSSSPVVSQNKNSSQFLKNEFLSSQPKDESVNNFQNSTVYRSKSSLEGTAKSNDSTIEINKVVSSSLSLDAHVEPFTSAEELKFKTEDINGSQFINDSKAIKKDFDCINFLENLISDSPSKKSNKDIDSGGKRTSVDSKRRYSERDSSSDGCGFRTKKVCRESSENELINMSLSKIDPSHSESNCSKNDENNIIDKLDLTQNSNDSDNSQSCSTLDHKASYSYINESCSGLKENNLITVQDIYNKTGSNRVIGSESEPEHLNDTEVKNLDTGTIVTTAIEETSKTDNKQHQDEWDSFDEMCNASEPEIFSQGLSKLLSSQNLSSNSEKSRNRSSSASKYQKQISSSNSIITSPRGINKQSSQKSTNTISLEDTLRACLNESILWKDENAPVLKSSSRDRKSALLQEHNKYYKTPTQQQRNVKTEDVTPPANYSEMKTPELKKELNRYGLKPSLTKKQAKIMLRYIYDQLHPFITVSDSEDSRESGENGLSRSPFKIPDKNTCVPRSPVKKVNCSGISRSSAGSRKNPVSVRRSLASQIDIGSDCDELSSHESSSSSTIDVAEEMLFEDLEGFDKEISGSQDICSSDNLSSVVQRYITENPELHQKVLQHEPIWIEEFLNDLKAQNYKFKMNHLMDYFDEQCITFRTLQAQKSRLRKRQRREAKKKNSPVKKKGKLSKTKSAATPILNSPNSSSN